MTKIVPIHYAISKPVKSYREIETAAKKLVAFIADPKLNGLYNKAFAIAHAQVSETPMAFFVVSADVLKEGMFETPVIINPAIISSPTHKKLDKVHPDMQIVNAIEYSEASISFPFRKPKKILRYDTIEVLYQIKGWFGLKTVRRELSGIASQIFQCMFDHSQGKNIFFDDVTPVTWWNLIGNKPGVNE